MISGARLTGRKNRNVAPVDKSLDVQTTLLYLSPAQRPEEQFQILQYFYQR